MIIIKRVWQNSANGQKSITIPKDSKIEKGDYVQVIKIKASEVKNETRISISKKRKRTKKGSK